jgi:DNA invertase Pin-like site-specific DNA recombinase
MTQQDHTNGTVARSGRAAIYGRIATREQTQASQALQSQMAALIAFANEHGYSSERIIVYEDVSIASSKSRARQKALSDLLAAISQEGQEPIRAIYVSCEHRLFRDLGAVELARFVAVCADHGVQLLTPTAIYDFSTLDQVALFRFECERAASYLAEQINMLMQPYRTGESATRKPMEE